MSASSHIRDDRGRDVPLYTLGAAFTVGAGDMPRETVERLRERLRGERPGTGLLRMSMWLALSSLTLGIAVLVLSGWRASSAFNVLTGVLLFAGLFWWSRYRFEQSAARQVREAMLAESRCASCAYDLTGVPKAADGCVVCPECGAAWRPSHARAEPQACHPAQDDRDGSRG